MSKLLTEEERVGAREWRRKKIKSFIKNPKSEHEWCIRVLIKKLKKCVENGY